MPLYRVNFGEDRSSSFGGEQANRWKLRCNKFINSGNDQATPGTNLVGF